MVTTIYIAKLNSGLCAINLNNKLMLFKRMNVIPNIMIKMTIVVKKGLFIVNLFIPIGGAKSLILYFINPLGRHRGKGIAIANI